VLEDNVEVDDSNIDFYHNGRIAVGNRGSGKIEELKELIMQRNPSLITNGRIFLGRMVNDRLWRLDDPEMIKLVVNLIYYSMIRDEYREIIKNGKAKGKGR
jgi:hypothetical protein